MKFFVKKMLHYYLIDLFFNTFFNQVFYLMIVGTYLLYNTLNSQTLFKWVLNGVAVLLFASSLLYFYNLELFATLLLLAELVVFIYFFILVVSYEKTHILTVKNLLPFIASLLFIASPTYSSYYNYFWLNWYASQINSVDIFSVFSFFYEYQPISIVYVGVLLSLITVLLGSLTTIYYIKTLKKTNKSSFFLKKQLKKRQVLKKTLFSFTGVSKNGF
jgi:hypothetical protein